MSILLQIFQGMEEEQVDFLLQIIVENAPKATVILVGTHRDLSKKQERNTQFLKRCITDPSFSTKTGKRAR